MNRKRESKLKAKVAAEIAALSPFDDPSNWAIGDFANSPWTQEQMDDFQKQLDSAFGGEKAIALVWSGDRKYGDEFYTDWHYNGLPKGRLERKPVLLFGEFKVSETDYTYVSCPRFLLMEVHHGSELESSWEESSWVADQRMFGGKKRIRGERPPEFFYTHLRVMSTHEQSTVFNGVPPCCERMWRLNKRICYGKYREPNETDIAYVRNIRQRMDAEGIVQRNDAPRSKKLLEKAGLATKHFMRQAEIARAKSTKEFMLANADTFFGDIVTRRGATMSPAELEKTVREALDADEEQRFA